MTHLQLAFLGVPEVYGDGRLLTFRTRKALALLIYLALEGGLQLREKLAALFWPESDAASSRAALRTTLSYLQRTLATSRQPVDYLLVTRDALAFNFDAAYRLDTESLEQAIKALTRSELAGNKVTEIEAVLDLYRGDFLEGFTLPDTPAFDDWISWQRSYWQRQMATMCDRLSQMQIEAGQGETAVTILNRWLAFDPLHEPAYRRLIRLQLAAGRRAAALQTYQTCRQRLDSELGVEPEPETQALAERARSAKDEDVRPKAKKPSSFTPHTSSFQLPFVGREEAHTQLAAAFHRAQRGETGVVLIEGEAGVGKTRLAETFLAWAQSREASLLRGQAYEMGGRLPYQPIVEAFRSVWEQRLTVNSQQATDNRQQQTANGTPSLSPAWLAELARLWPELHEQYPDLPPPAGGELAQGRLFEAVGRLGKWLAQRAPLVLFIDDLQWADAASLDLLHYLERRWREWGLPVLILFNLRAEARRQPVAALADFLAYLQREASLTRLALARLVPADVDELVRRLNLPQAQQAPFTHWLYGETGGSPFYIAETVKALLEAGHLQWRPAAAGDWQLDAAAVTNEDGGLAGFVAPAIHDVVRSRLARLPPAAFDLLAAAAVLGQSARFRHLCQVAGVHENEGLGALDELQAAYLLQESDDAYRFTHDKIRDVVYTDAGAARRRLFHERAWQQLQADGAAPARLAHHAQAAHRHQAALEQYIAAGDEAMKLFAVRDALNFYEQARQILQEETAVTLSPAQRRHLYERLGRGYELVDQWAAATAVYQELLAYARSIQAPELQVAALNRLGGVAIIGEWQLAPAAAFLQEAQTIAAAANDQVGLIESECTLCQIGQFQFEREAAVAHAQRALDLARQVGDEALVARSLNLLAYALMGPPAALPQVEAAAAEASDIFRRLGNRALEADSLAMAAATQLHRGRTRNALPQLQAAQAIVREIENSWGQVNVAFHLAFALLELGREDEALAVVQEGVQTARRDGHTTLLYGALAARGTVYRALGDLERALADHQAAQQGFEQLPLSLLPAISAVHCCADCALAGDWPAASEYARQSLAVRDLTWLWTWMQAGFFYDHVIEALLWAGEVETAVDALARFRQAVGDNPRYRIPYLRAQAVTAEYKGRSDHLNTLAEEA
jgi:predicted ATPase/DNA-binding SARP family transcriptional activator